MNDVSFSYAQVYGLGTDLGSTGLRGNWRRDFQKRGTGVWF